MYHHSTRWYTRLVPTRRQRHQITETDAIQATIDRAALAWPELQQDRAGLLRRIIELGGERLPPPRIGPADLAEYEGRWVALTDDRVVLSGATPGEVAQGLVERGIRAEQLFRVPVDDTEIEGALEW